MGRKGCYWRYCRKNWRFTFRQHQGRRIQYLTSRYERVPANRQAAIRIHGTVCQVCGFDFYQHYGELGKNYIEVHHIKPLSSLDEEVIIDPYNDLVCLCANCHRMMHRNSGHVMTVEELKRAYREWGESNPNTGCLVMKYETRRVNNGLHLWCHPPRNTGKRRRIRNLPLGHPQGIRERPRESACNIWWNWMLIKWIMNSR